MLAACCRLRDVLPFQLAFWLARTAPPTPLSVAPAIPAAVLVCPVEFAFGTHVPKLVSLVLCQASVAVVPLSRFLRTLANVLQQDGKR